MPVFDYCLEAKEAAEELDKYDLSDLSLRFSESISYAMYLVPKSNNG